MRTERGTAAAEGPSTPSGMEVDARAPQSSVLRFSEMTNAANRFAAFVACLPAAYEVSCRIRAGSPRGFWPHSPRTVASRLFGSPVPRRRGLGWQAATIWRRGEVYAVVRRSQLLMMGQ